MVRNRAAIKTSNKKEARQANKELKEQTRVKELTQQQALYFKELVDASNKFVATKKQKAQYEFTLKKLQETRNEIQSGKIPMPLTMTLIPNMLYKQVTDKKEVLKLFDDQIKTYQTNIKSLEGMIQHNYDEYIESSVRTREFINRKFANLIAKDIAPERKIIKDEETLFEAEFNELMKDPKKQEEFKKAKLEAVKKNVVRQQKGSD